MSSASTLDAVRSGGLIDITTTAISGVISGTGTLFVKGDLRPRNSPGVLTFGSSLNLGSTSTTTMELNGNARGTDYDGIDVTGALTYGGALTINVGGTFLGPRRHFRSSPLAADPATSPR